MPYAAVRAERLRLAFPKTGKSFPVVEKQVNHHNGRCSIVRMGFAPASARHLLVSGAPMGPPPPPLGAAPTPPYSWVDCSPTLSCVGSLSLGLRGMPSNLHGGASGCLNLSL